MKNLDYENDEVMDKYYGLIRQYANDVDKCRYLSFILLDILDLESDDILDNAHLFQKISDIVGEKMYNMVTCVVADVESMFIPYDDVIGKINQELGINCNEDDDKFHLILSINYKKHIIRHKHLSFTNGRYNHFYSYQNGNKLLDNFINSLPVYTRWSCNPICIGADKYTHNMVMCFDKFEFGDVYYNSVIDEQFEKITQFLEEHNK